MAFALAWVGPCEFARPAVRLLPLPESSPLSSSSVSPVELRAPDVVV